MRVVFTVAYLLLLAALVVLYVRRRRILRSDGAFRCKLRVIAGRSVLWPRLRQRWLRRRLWARWADDALVVWRDGMFLRKVRLPARIRHDGVYTLTSDDVTRCGHRPIAVELEVCDGSRIEVAAPESARLALVGPYVTAALHGLPRAPAPRRQTPGPGS